jgi:hypothetical protein
MNYEPSEKMNTNRNEMSSAVRLFHPGFSPESSSMLLLITGRSSGFVSLFNTFPSARSEQWYEDRTAVSRNRSSEQKH